MPKMTLTYFDAPASRGEECRLALFLADLPFTDDRLKGPDAMARMPSTPFGALPVLTVEGQRPLAQSNAILRLIGHMHGLLPTEPWESARHESVMGAVEDFRGRLAPTNRIKEAEEKKAARIALATGYMQDWAGSIEKQINGPFVGGDAISVADLKIFVTLTPILAGKIDHIPIDNFKAFPKLMKLFESVKAHPKVVAWYARPAAN